MSYSESYSSLMQPASFALTTNATPDAIVVSNFGGARDFQAWKNVYRQFAQHASKASYSTAKLFIESLPKYRLRRNMLVTVEQTSDNEFIATFPESGIAISGDSAFEALQLLKAHLADTFEIFSSRATLGPEPKRQLRVLEGYIGEKGRK